MPWSKSDVDRFKSGLSDAQKERWVRIANDALRRCLDNGGSQENCEASAIRQANGVVGNMEHIYAHLRAERQIRYENWQERRHLIAPVVLLTAGVHHGSAGRILYTQEELSRMPAAWNGAPVPVLHPTDNTGSPLSCNEPDVLENQNVGRVFRVNWEPGNQRLKGEIWIDINKAKQVCQRLSVPDAVDMIESGQPVEVSTGLIPEQSGESGTFGNQEYDASAHHIHADHLALLPGGRGACAWEDGCGVRNYQGGSNGMKRTIPAKKNNADETFQSIVNQEQNDGNEEAIKFAQRVAYEYLNSESDEMEMPEDLKAYEPLMNKLQKWFHQQMIEANEGYREIMSQLQRKLDSLDNSQMTHFLEDVYEDGTFVYKEESDNGVRYFQQGYQKNEDGTIEFSDSPQQVTKRIEFQPIQSQNYENEGGNEMTKNQTQNGCCPEKIEAIINSQVNGFTEDDRETLQAYDEAFLDKIPLEEPQVNNQETQTQNSEENDMNQVDFDTLLKNADAETRQSIERGRELYRQERQQMVDKIVNSQNSQFTQEELGQMDHTMLIKIANSIAPQVHRGPAGGPPVNDNNAVEDQYEDGLDMPWMQSEQPETNKQQ